MPPCLTSTSWARLKKAYVLKGLDIPRNLWKYAGALAFVLTKQGEAVANICIVLRLYVRIERLGGKPLSKWLPQLLHPKMIGVPKKDWDIPYPMGPEMWWQFGLHHQLEMISEGVYKFKRPRGDMYMPPFMIFCIPVTALHVTGVVPKLSELNMFHEGMVIGSVHLRFPALSPDFIQWSYECFVAAPLEIGNKVEVNMNPGLVRGVIEEQQFENVVVHITDTEGLQEIEVHTQNTRRYYQPGNTVKVVRSPKAVESENLDHEGLVLIVNKDQIQVFDHILKEQV